MPLVVPIHVFSLARSAILTGLWSAWEYSPIAMPAGALAVGTTASVRAESFLWEPFTEREASQVAEAAGSESGCRQRVGG